VLRSSAPQLAHQPYLCEPPISHHRLRGHLQHFCGLLDRQPTEEPQLDHLGPTGIHLRERFERVVERADLGGCSHIRAGNLIEIESRRVEPDPTAPFRRGARASGIH